MSHNSPPTRREALKLGLLSALATLPLPTALARTTHESNRHVKQETTKTAQALPTNEYTWLKPSEALFVEAATERLIPADAKWGGARAAGVTNYFDKQMGGRWAPVNGFTGAGLGSREVRHRVTSFHLRRPSS